MSYRDDLPFFLTNHQQVISQTETGIATGMRGLVCGLAPVDGKMTSPLALLVTRIHSKNPKPYALIGLEYSP